jgi:cytochrome c peroxidase
VALGKMLFFDRRLSRDGTVSCSTCHDPKHAWAEPRRVSVGILNQSGKRNSPTVLNAAYLPVQFWDGRAKTLEEQAKFPIEDAVEMGHRLDRIVLTLSTIDEYEDLFEEAFGTGVTGEGVLAALASFERTILSGDSPYDRYVAGKRDALTPEQIRGLEIFAGKGSCATCHVPPTFTDGKFYVAGIGQEAKKPDEGRMLATGKEEHRDQFRTPALREVENTAPYFHDGSVADLEEAVRIMARGGVDHPNLSERFRDVRRANLTEEEVKALTAFLRALSGDYPVTEEPELP